eukprot:Skav209063  [mRNA]  locus=scaffold760:250904:251868:- [translate_table: standard]
MLVGIAYSVAFVVYAEFAWAGFRRFEWAVEGNVLKNYGPQLNILIAWLGMGFSIAFTYPLVFNSAREAAINLTLMARRQMSSIPLLHQVMSSPRFQHLQRGHSGSSWQRRSAQLIGLLGPSPDSPNHKLSRKPGTKTTVLLVFCTYVVGVRCTDVGVVNALAGSIMGCMVCLVLPGLLFFKTARMQRRSREVQKSRGLNEVLLPKGLGSWVPMCGQLQSCVFQPRHHRTGRHSLVPKGSFDVLPMCESKVLEEVLVDSSRDPHSRSSQSLFRGPMACVFSIA